MNKIIRSYLTRLNIKAKHYFELNDEIIAKLFELNKIFLMTISRDPEEYMSGQKSKTRLILARIIDIIILIHGIKYLLLSIIRDVSF